MRLPRPSAVLLLATAVLLTAVVLPSGNAAGHETFVVEGNELAACTLPALLCFNTVAGDPATDILEGETVIVTLRAGGEAPHNINVIEESDSDALHVDTPVGEAIASSSTVDAGLETSFQFEAPAEGTVLYFWCDIGEHEVAGMWFTATVGPAPAGVADNNTTGGPTTQNETGPGSGGNATSGNVTAEGNQTAEGPGDGSDADNGTQAADDGAVEAEDAPVGPAVWAVAALGGVLWSARRRR